MDVVSAPPSTLSTAPTVPATRSAFTAAVLGWLVPGFGQLYVGRPFKALLMFVAIGGLFYAGLALTGFTCVNPNTYSLEFVAHAFLGGPTAAAYYLTQDIALTEALPWFEVGRLYAAVAGLLNVVAICDALSEVIEHNRDVRARATLRQRYLHEREEARRRALEAAAAQQAAAQEVALQQAAAAEEGAALDDDVEEEVRRSRDDLPFFLGGDEPPRGEGPSS